MKKRYSIVRVDGECPKGFNEDIYCKWCGNCGKLYGDTKEQLIRKVAQVIRKQIKKNYIDVNIGKIGYFIRVEELAKEIVEFLGVVE